MLGLVVFPGLGELDHVIEEVLRKTAVEAGHRCSGLVRRFDLLDAIVTLSSKPVSASQPSRRAAGDQNHHHTGASNQRAVKCAVNAKAVGTAPH